MPSPLGSLLQHLDDDRLRLIGAQLGVDETTTGAAIAAALPVLVGGLAENAASGPGASTLATVLDRDHDGAVLDDIDGFIGNWKAGNGDGIIGHVLGDRRGAVEQQLADATGLDATKTSSLLAILAPLVLGALGRAKTRRRADARGVVVMLGEAADGLDTTSAR